jgi:hypothetical protein
MRLSGIFVPSFWDEQTPSAGGTRMITVGQRGYPHVRRSWSIPGSRGLGP